MGETELMQEEPEEQVMTPVEIWERLDQTTRDRVVELLAYLAYNFVVNAGVIPVEED